MSRGPKFDAPYSDKPSPKNRRTASRELIKLGRAAIPQLLRALDSSIATKIHPSRHFRDPWLVRDAAMDAIEHIACRLFGRDVGMFKLKGEGEEDQKIRRSVAAWWEQNKSSDEVQWAKDFRGVGVTTRAGPRYMGIDSLYLRLGKESYPFLARLTFIFPRAVKTSIVLK